MSRYIDADKLLESGLHYSCGIDDERGMFVLLGDVLKSIKEMPNADVEEVKHGEWEEVTTNAIDDLAFDTVASMRCPKCDRYHNRVYHYGDPTEMEHYCSFCGAKMDGKEQTDDES